MNRKNNWQKLLGLTLALIALVLVQGPSSLAQTKEPQAPSPEVQQLKERLQQLEQNVKDLKDRIADLNRVWILADVSRHQVPFVRRGASARITTAGGGRAGSAAGSQCDTTVDEG